MKYVIYPLGFVIIGVGALVLLAAVLAGLGFAWSKASGLSPEVSMYLGAATFIVLMLVGFGIDEARRR